MLLQQWQMVVHILVTISVQLPRSGKQFSDSLDSMKMTA